MDILDGPMFKNAFKWFLFMLYGNCLHLIVIKGRLHVFIWQNIYCLHFQMCFLIMCVYIYLYERHNLQNCIFLKSFVRSNSLWVQIWEGSDDIYLYTLKWQKYVHIAPGVTDTIFNVRFFDCLTLCCSWIHTSYQQDTRITFYIF